MEWISFIKNNMHRFINNHGSFIEHSICFTICRIAKEYTFIGFSIEFTKIISIIQYKALTSKNFEISNVRFSIIP